MINMSSWTRNILIFAIYGFAMAENITEYFGNKDEMMFPGPIATRRTRQEDVRTAKGYGEVMDVAKSLQLAREINAAESIEDFLRLVGGVPKEERNFFLESRFGETEERSNAERPVPASCVPELQPVPLKQDNDPSTIYYPPCTRVKRCGGCCTHALLSCQPTASEVRNFEVVVVSLGGSMGLNYKTKTIVPVEEHTKCMCDCRMKPKDCTEKQSYVPEECMCVCNNIDEAEKCRKSSDIKVWHPDHCNCRCRKYEECNTGFYFDQNTCRCQQVPFSRSWFPPTKGTDYKFGQTERPETSPPLIVALDASDPRRKPKEDPEYK